MRKKSLKNKKRFVQQNGRYVQVCAGRYVQPAEGMCRTTARYVQCPGRDRTPKTMNGGMCRYVRRVCAGMCEYVRVSVAVATIAVMAIAITSWVELAD